VRARKLAACDVLRLRLQFACGPRLSQVRSVPYIVAPRSQGANSAPLPRISLAIEKLAANACLLSDVSEKLVNAGSVWVVLSILDVLDTITAVVCSGNKTGPSHSHVTEIFFSINRF
jgi:hypothetical protein